MKCNDSIYMGSKTGVLRPVQQSGYIGSCDIRKSKSLDSYKAMIKEFIKLHAIRSQLMKFTNLAYRSNNYIYKWSCDQILAIEFTQ